MNLQFLIKFTKAEWADDFKNRGKLFFNPAYKFCSSPHYSIGQYDKFDSHINYNAMHLCWAPIIEESANGIKNGPGKKLADNALLHILNSRNKNIPICCFRSVFEDEIKNNIFRIDNVTYNKICNDFPDYDSFVLIIPELFLDIILRTKWGKKMYGHTVYYGETVEFDKYYTNNWEKGFEEKYPYLQMFNKAKEYEYQQEYRMIIPGEYWENGNCIEIGSPECLRDIVLTGKINQLNIGYNIKKIGNYLYNIIEELS